MIKILDFINMFLFKFAEKLLKYSIHNYTIKLIKNKQLLYS